MSRYSPFDTYNSVKAWLESMAPLEKALQEHRAKLEADGYSPAAAELVVAELHRHVIQRLNPSTEEPT